MLASRMARSGLRPSGRKTARVVGESSPAHLARLAPTRFAVGEPTLKGRRLSVGRASLLHSGGRRFEPCTVHGIYANLMRYILSIIGVAVGALIVIKSEKIFNALGPVQWAEQHLGAEGGSRLFYKLVGVGIIVVSFFYMSRILESIGLAIFGRLFGISR